MPPSSSSPRPTASSVAAMHRTWCQRKLRAVTSYTGPAVPGRIRETAIRRTGYRAPARQRRETSCLPTNRDAARSIASVSNVGSAKK